MKTKLIKLLALSLLLTSLVACKSKETSVAKTCTINGVSVDPSQCQAISTPTKKPSALTEQLNAFATITIPIEFDFDSNTFEILRSSYTTTKMNDHYKCIAGLSAGEYQVDLIENEQLSLSPLDIVSDVKYDSTIGYTEALDGTVWTHFSKTYDDTMKAQISIESNLEFNEDLTRISIKVFCDATPL
jgi:hypothetical protein